MTTAAAHRARYAGTSLQTASPQVLLLRLYDRLALDLLRAADAQDSGDHRLADQQLQHGQAIVSALTGALDVEAWDGAPGLKGLYTWLLKEMVTANTRRDASRTRSCLTVVEPLRSAWHEAQATLTGGRSEVPAPQPEPAVQPAALVAQGPAAPATRVPLAASRALGGTGAQASALLRARVQAAGRPS